MAISRTRRILPPLWGLLLLVLLNPGLGHSEEFLRFESLNGALDTWKAFQTNMNDHGILLETVNTLDVLSNVSGGIHQKTAVVGDLDLLLTVDTEKLISGWQGGTLFVYGLGTYGDDPSKHVGDIQAVSGIAAPNTWKLFEAWYQQNLFERFSLLAGLYDVTSEFDVMASSSELFVNSSFGTGAEFATSGKIGPSTFPATSLGIRGQAIVNDNLMVRAVLADGVPGNPNNPHGTHIQLSEDDGLFGTMELAYYKFRKGDILAGKSRRLTFRRVGRSAPLEYEAKVALGLWGYTTSLDHLSKVESSGSPSKQHGTYGLYGLAEYDVYHEQGDNDQELTLFGRAGMADPRVNRFSQYYGGGLVYRGLFPGRNFDQTGIGVAAAVNGKYYKRSQRKAGQSADNAEITLEVTHSIYVNRNIFIQPDVQYVMNPGTVPGRKNALVLGVRLEFNLNWFNPQRIS
ncbi:MAG: carbohydrate porin [Nitrospirota bacterium]|nr:carbohydrate porin [Nitrospirota bacterium]